MNLEGSKSPKNEVSRAIKRSYLLGYVYMLFSFSMKVLMVF